MRQTWTMVVVLVAGMAGCGGSGSVTATERLWISDLPTSPRRPVTAFLTTRSRDASFIGGFFQGTAFEGHHRLFQWLPDGDDRARIKFLQDGVESAVRFERCEPSSGFHYCLLLHGDPTGTKRYQSRKRWAVRRPRKSEWDTHAVLGAFAELADEHDDVRELLAADTVPLR